MPVFLAGGSRSPEKIVRPEESKSGQLKAGAELGTHMFQMWYRDYMASQGLDIEND